jgi:transcriptional regulator with XRE-family HTH domain
MDEPKPMRELTRIREERGLTQQGLADASGVNKATINQIERGRRSPNLETLEKLATGLDVEMADFFPKAQAPLPMPLDSPVDEADTDEERDLRFLRAFRAFIDAYARRWEAEPPTFRETASLNGALVEVLRQGVLELPPIEEVGPKELDELERFEDGVDRLIEIAARVKGEERAGEQEAS